MSPLPTISLTQNFRGEIVLPDDKGYLQAGSTFITQGKPAIVVYPTTPAEVVAAIQFGRKQKLTISIRSGGHSGAGWSTNDQGLVIDVSHLNEVQVVNVSKRLVRVGAGAQWGQVAQSLKSKKLAVSAGDTESVGVSGLTLGGGIGWMVRKFGLALDCVVGAEMVTAEGQILTVNDQELPDLFWAIRGGGGNFGVVTAFEFCAHPVDFVLGGNIVYPLVKVAQLLTGWRDAMREAPESLTTMCLVMPGFQGNPPAFIVTCCCAQKDEATAKKAIEPLAHLGKPVNQDFSWKPYAKMLETAHPIPGMRIIVNNGFMKEFSDEAIQKIDQLCSADSSPMFQIRSLGGAMNQIAKDKTAFAHRDSEVLIINPAFMPADAPKEMAEQVTAPWRLIEPFTAGTYVNFLSERDSDLIEKIYPAKTLKRLKQIKQQYDPENIFNQNYNIEPNKN